MHQSFPACQIEPVRQSISRGRPGPYSLLPWHFQFFFDPQAALIFSLSLPLMSNMGLERFILINCLSNLQFPLIAASDAHWSIIYAPVTKSKTRIPFLIKSSSQFVARRTCYIIFTSWRILCATSDRWGSRPTYWIWPNPWQINSLDLSCTECFLFWSSDLITSVQGAGPRLLTPQSLRVASKFINSGHIH